MNLLGGTMPEHGMTRDEADELVRDLRAAGIEVVRADELVTDDYVEQRNCSGGVVEAGRVGA